MQTIFLRLKYDGSHYRGWQRQNSSPTIQGVLEKALTKLLKQEITIDGSGRTDAGVHALDQCVTFKAHLIMPVENLKFALNKILPIDIYVNEVQIVPNDFHARYSAVGKTYAYKVYTDYERNPFLDRYHFHFPHKLDSESMKSAMAHFIGTYDYSTYMASGSSTKNTTRTIYRFDLDETDESYVFTITGNGFLYNMVRIIVGTVLHVGVGKIAPDQILDIIESKDRNRAKFTPPGNGLYLKNVYYDAQTLNEFVSEMMK